jgi:alkylation response protein AidB-like acyl-CoA dehydrogenase
MLPAESFCRTEAQRALLAQAAALAPGFAARAAAHDRDATFPFENFEELRRAGILGLTAPTSFGGQGAGVLDAVLLLERLARADGSTALALGWHLSNIGKLAESGAWSDAQRARVFTAAVRDGGLLNSAASEHATGSPSRGGRPTTRARRTDEGWILDGRKVYVTAAPALAHFIVSATLEESGGATVANFLVPRDAPGVRVEATWDALGMRASGSDDLVLEGARLPADARLDTAPQPGHSNGAGWGLHTPAVYLGVAEAARDFAAAFAAYRQPNSMAAPIGEAPHVQQRLARVEMALLPARTLLFTLADRWDRGSLEERGSLGPALAACKSIAIQAALDAVDEAMRVVGAPGLTKAQPIERYYRDVRAGLHNPPMEDTVWPLLANAMLREATAGQ